MLDDLSASFAVCCFRDAPLVQGCERFKDRGAQCFVPRIVGELRRSPEFGDDGERIRPGYTKGMQGANQLEHRRLYGG